MNKFAYYNDTGRMVSIHPATQIHGCECDMAGIKHGEIREFILPEGTYAWVKMWDYGEKHGLQILVSPHSYEEKPVIHEPSDHEILKRELSPHLRDLLERGNKAMKKLKDSRGE
jgi:hypothetical protein